MSLRQFLLLIALILAFNAFALEVVIMDYSNLEDEITTYRLNEERIEEDPCPETPPYFHFAR